MKILITGGPVHAHLDAVKIITNRFRGGLMCDLAVHLAQLGAKVTYLCAPKAGAQIPDEHHNIHVETHNGFEDYRQNVLQLAPQMQGVVLGAAVANLIPKSPIKGKFPSHNYKPRDIIPIDFMIAPRVIDEVKKVASKTHLFGFKLLDGVPHSELISAAYGIVLESKATVVFANDAQNLMQKYAVTKERGVHPLRQEDVAPWLWEMLYDKYYSSSVVEWPDPYTPEEPTQRVRELIGRYKNRFVSVESGLIFGTVAVRHGGGFVTTGRGKRELDSIAYVHTVDHTRRIVYINRVKASLNAPLLARLFENEAVDSIVHYHEQVEGLPNQSYAPPGTVRDSIRYNRTSFNIREHGCMLLFDKNGRQI